jgi:hypothetical protein
MAQTSSLRDFGLIAITPSSMAMLPREAASGHGRRGARRSCAIDRMIPRRWRATSRGGAPRMTEPQSDRESPGCIRSRRSRLPCAPCHRAKRFRRKARRGSASRAPAPPAEATLIRTLPLSTAIIWSPADPFRNMVSPAAKLRKRMRTRAKSAFLSSGRRPRKSQLSPSSRRERSTKLRSVSIPIVHPCRQWFLPFSSGRSQSRGRVSDISRSAKHAIKTAAIKTAHRCN